MRLSLFDAVTCAAVLDAVAAVATVVAAVAALGALWFAWQTVVETRRLRSEDRLARLLELAGDLGDIGVLVASGREHEMRLDIARQRLRAGLAASGETLPACERLIEIDFEQIYKVSDPADHQRRKSDAETAIADALQELGELLQAAP